MCDIIDEGPNDEEKIGDGMNGGKPLVVIGNGEDILGTVVGDALGDAKIMMYLMYSVKIRQVGFKFEE